MLGPDWRKRRSVDQRGTSCLTGPALLLYSDEYMVITHRPGCVGRHRPSLSSLPHLGLLVITRGAILRKENPVVATHRVPSRSFWDDAICASRGTRSQVYGYR